MAIVIGNHRVADYNKWKQGFDADAARRDNAGAKVVAVGEKDGDPGNVFIIMEVADLSKMQAMMSDPELQQKMRELGVLTPAEMTVLR